jgi:hypothetical protein
VARAGAVVGDARVGRQQRKPSGSDQRVGVCEDRQRTIGERCDDDRVHVVEWVGKDRIVAVFNLTGKPSGTYDVVVYNPGGASGVLPGAFQISGGVTAAGDMPHHNALLPAYPNPFNPETTIRYELAARSRVSLRIYDVSGSVVRTLVDEDKAGGLVFTRVERSRRPQQPGEFRCVFLSDHRGQFLRCEKGDASEVTADPGR